MKRYITELINDMIKKNPCKRPAFECMKANYKRELITELETIKQVIAMVESENIYDYDERMRAEK